MPPSFWDFKERSSKKASVDPIDGAAKEGGITPLTVSQLTHQIDRALKDSLPASVLVRGEVSNFKAHGASGHYYFTLKDAGACLDCVMFRSEVERLRFKPCDGLELIATGRVGVYGQRGKYQLYATTLQPLGQGALELARQQIEARLRAEGLFDADRKRLVPRFPERLAIVTSTGTAALQDILKVFRRFGFLRIFVYHVPVQGEGGARKIAAALAHLSKTHKQLGGIDAILLARGGGSLEDLWQFNEEVVARAVAACAIPVVTGIGHQIDVSIADLAADYHAHTPTEAAQVVTAHWRSAEDLIATGAHRLGRQTRATISEARQRLEAITRHELFRRPLDAVNQFRQRLDDREQGMALAVASRLREERLNLARFEVRLHGRHPRHLMGLHAQRLTSIGERLTRAMTHARQSTLARVEALSARLESVNPETVLQRGYSITVMKKGGQIVRNPADVRAGDVLITRLGSGEVESTVKDARQMDLFGG